MYWILGFIVVTALSFKFAFPYLLITMFVVLMISSARKIESSYPKHKRKYSLKNKNKLSLDDQKLLR